MKKSNVLNMHNFNYLICKLFVMLIILPPFKLIGAYNWLVLTVAIIWLLTVLLIKSNFIFSNKMVILSFIWFMYSFVMSTITGNLYLFKRFFDVFFILIFVAMYQFYNKYNKHIFTKISQTGMKLLPFLFVVSTFWGVRIPYMLRGIDKADSMYTQYQLYGVSGYSLVYTAVLWVPICLFIFLRKNNTYYNKILVLINIITGMIFVLNAGFTFAWIFLLISSMFILLVRKIRMRYLIVIASFSFIMLFNIDIFLKYLLVKFQGTLFVRYNQAKIIEILRILQNGNDSGVAISAREYVYGRSIEGILENPVLGSITSHNQYFGNHSTILDITSIYGIAMGLLFVYIIFNSLIKMYENNNKGIEAPILIISTIIFAMIITLNNLAPQFGYPLFFLLPTVTNNILYKSNSLWKE